MCVYNVIVCTVGLCGCIIIIHWHSLLHIYDLLIIILYLLYQISSSFYSSLPSLFFIISFLSLSLSLFPCSVSLQLFTISLFICCFSFHSLSLSLSLASLSLSLSAFILSLSLVFLLIPSLSVTICHTLRLHIR